MRKYFFLFSLHFFGFAWSQSAAVTAKIKPIQNNFTQINATKKFDKVKSVDIHESTDGGTITYYYKNNALQKVVATNYGESGKNLIEYYLLKGKLSFVYEQDFAYNVPYYMDKAKAKELGDSEYFDPKKTKIRKNRSYFDNGKIIYQIMDKDFPEIGGHPTYTMEQKRINKDFDFYLSFENQ